MCFASQAGAKADKKSRKEKGEEMPEEKESV